MVTGAWNSDRFWTRSRNVRGAHVRSNGETIARPREESLVSGFCHRENARLSFLLAVYLSFAAALILKRSIAGPRLATMAQLRRSNHVEQPTGEMGECIYIYRLHDPFLYATRMFARSWCLVIYGNYVMYISCLENFNSAFYRITLMN